jgi:ribosome-binding protein aMBF1 (putative translation factor)
MPPRKTNGVGPAGNDLRALIRREREKRGLSLRGLSQSMTEAGWPIALTGISNIEVGRRQASVDDAVAFATVLRFRLDRLLPFDVCATCQNEPPDGFACNTCGRG